MDRYKEEKIFQAALKALRNNFVFPIQFDVITKEKKHETNEKIDRVLKITIQNKETLFCVEVKNNVAKPVVGLLNQRGLTCPHPVLLVGVYVNNVMADRLKQHNIEFIDTAGNAFINRPPTYLFAKGNKPNEDFTNIPKGQAFRTTGLKAILAFLQYPNLINETYREIARVANIALGNVGWIIGDLKKQGFVVDMGKKGGKLIHKKRLLEQFVEQYPRRLRDKLLLGRYKGGHEMLDHWKIDFQHALWGGEVAAAKMTGYLRPQNVTVYLEQGYLNKFLLENRLKKDIEGEIEILNMFWKPLTSTEPCETVNPILVYADLIATADQRNIETARVLFEKHIERHIGED